jgi:hypothetical protein
MNPLICNTTALYHGCRNIRNYFGDQLIVLTGDLRTDVDLIRQICTNPEKYRKTIHPEEVKNTIDLLKNIQTLFC